MDTVVFVCLYGWAGAVKSVRAVNCVLNGLGDGRREKAEVRGDGVSGGRCISYQRDWQRRKGKCKRQAGCATGQP